MEFLAGMVMGVILTIGSSFTFGFYNKSEKKDELLAKSLDKQFHEGITLNDIEVKAKRGKVV